MRKAKPATAGTAVRLVCRWDRLIVTPDGFPLAYK